ncbi:hypothetical protein D3H35_00550 [Cohnella faecalis]|uniref:Uncharacterized protein n=1 Tax=Cohnella faecalis TaxID=2315694 RepID=A0A398D1N8_9BACL|nr:hypothetical protein D3H35_00550 [Cohnella faecalis]
MVAERKPAAVTTSAARPSVSMNLATSPLSGFPATDTRHDEFRKSELDRVFDLLLQVLFQLLRLVHGQSDVRGRCMETVVGESLLQIFGGNSVIPASSTFLYPISAICLMVQGSLFPARSRGIQLNAQLRFTHLFIHQSIVRVSSLHL